MDVTKYADGYFYKWRTWKGIRKNVFRGSNFPKHLYSAGRIGRDCIRIQLPGSIRAFHIRPGEEIVVQKGGFLAAEAGIQLSVHFHKKLASGFFGGEGFILQRISGEGVMFAEFDGHVIEYELQPGQQIVIDTGHLAAMTASCQMDIQTVPGLKKQIFRGRRYVFNHSNYRTRTCLAADHANQQCGWSTSSIFPTGN